MKLIRDVAAWPPELRQGAVSIGNFDGVHLGHARLVERLVAKAREVGGPALVFTFDPHPATLLRPSEAPAQLATTARKAELLASLGVDALLVYPTTKQFLSLSAREFFDQIVLGALSARAMVEGRNFQFGRGREGAIPLLAEFCRGAGLLLDVVEPVVWQDAVVSSSRVRQLIAQGDVAAAAEILTQPYRIAGNVSRGAGRGAAIGFPTANLTGVVTQLPAPGVYAGRGFVAGTAFPAAINLGPNPTFGEGALKIEAHLIGYAGDLYGQPLEVDFVQRLRDIERFENVAALTAQLRRDVDRTQQITTEGLG